ncbi:nuclear transport factor 2 family protein [Nocardia arthritidis]|uniref:nuclear transport factor 2 family protein n=1 Tax=Nocardia arthritidis TaxID=228602 RepID=UPI0019337026|nr:nuclear transport factor 2 family protein [Nocardia arthritidis]
MSTDVNGIAFERLYAEVQQFYAQHFQLLDSGAAEEWAATFTEDGVFAPPTLPQPVRGRVALAEGLRRTIAELAAAGEVHRHWHGMISVDQDQDGSVRVTCYALVLATKLGGDSRLHRVCVCTDRLVREAGAFRVLHRSVTRDDLAAPAAFTAASAALPGFRSPQKTS